MDTRRGLAELYRQRGDRGTIEPWHRYATIMQAKRICIDTAAQFVEREGSMTASTASQNMTTEFNFTPNCHNMMNSLAEKRPVELLWIPGQNGIRSNQIEDNFARLETGHLFMNTKPAVEIS